jgi:hypothetical protein
MGADSLDAAAGAAGMSEQARFDLIAARCGRPTAGAWLLTNVIRGYRKVVLAHKTHTIYRRQLIEAYVTAKRVLR